METRAEKYYRVRDALNENPGYKYLNRIKLHERSVHIFGGNFSDLMRMLNFLEDPQNFHEVWGEDNRDRQALAHREVVRHFHNFLSAAQSLVEHTRSFMRKNHNGQPIFISYSKQIEKNFSNDSLARFVQDLRNYFLHKGIPSSSMNLSIDTSGTKPPLSRVLLKVSTLKEWKEWKKESKEYLANFKDEILLRDVVEAYQKKVREFYLWFRHEMDEWHKDELASYKIIQKEYNDFVDSNSSN